MFKKLPIIREIFKGDHNAAVAVAMAAGEETEAKNK